MPSRTTCTLVTTLLLTPIACARQEEPEYFDADEMMDDDDDDGGSTSSGRSPGGSSGTSKAGSSSGGKGGGTTLPPAGSIGGKGGSQSTGGSSNDGGAEDPGASGSGGSAGSAGSAGAGGGGGPINMPLEGLSVTFKAIEGQGQVDFIGGELFVHNDSGASLSLGALKIRYYFTNELIAEPAFIWNWGQAGPTSNLSGITCTGTVEELTPPRPTANFYVELTCPAGDVPTAGQLRTSWKAGNQGQGQLTQNDDWSYIPTEGEADKIVVLNGDTIIWGIEP